MASRSVQHLIRQPPGPGSKWFFNNNVPGNVTLYVPILLSNGGGTMAFVSSETGPFSAWLRPVEGRASGTAAIAVVAVQPRRCMKETTSAPNAIKRIAFLSIYRLLRARSRFRSSHHCDRQFCSDWRVGQRPELCQWRQRRHRQRNGVFQRTPR